MPRRPTLSHMPRPIIGITADHNSEYTQQIVPQAYPMAVERAGGLAVILPYRDDLSLVGDVLDGVDAMLLSGGDDLDPSAWGEARHPEAVPCDPRRERWERALLAEIERRRMPVLGICFGCQLMNVHRGGSLHQFLPDVPLEGALEHRRLDLGWARRHDVELDPDSIYARRLRQTRISVNTSHREAVARVGNGLRVFAKAPDGVIEGVEDPALPLYVGVQWHAERLAADGEPAHVALFEMLVEHARQNLRPRRT